MKRVILIISFLLMTSLSYAGYNVCYDEYGKNLFIKGSSPIKGCLYYSDKNMDEYKRVKGLNLKYCNVVDGKVVEISKAEKDAIIASELKAKEMAKKENIESLNITIKQLVNALENNDIITKTQIIDKVKTDENITSIGVIDAIK